jgi:hypothetical protein
LKWVHSSPISEDHLKTVTLGFHVTIFFFAKLVALFLVPFYKSKWRRPIIYKTILQNPHDHYGFSHDHSAISQDHSANSHEHYANPIYKCIVE